MGRRAQPDRARGRGRRASAKKKRLDKEQLIDLLKKRRAARAAEDEETVAADAAADADADAGLLRAAAEDKALRGGQRDLEEVRTRSFGVCRGERTRTSSLTI